MEEQERQIEAIRRDLQGEEISVIYRAWAALAGGGR